MEGRTTRRMDDHEGKDRQIDGGTDGGMNRQRDEMKENYRLLDLHWRLVMQLAKIYIQTCALPIYVNFS
jgi:hypothetical protein